MESDLKLLASQFQIDGKFVSCEPEGNGHINHTYKLVMETSSGKKDYILQHINKYVFPKPDELMDNFVRITSHIRSKIEAEGGEDIDRRSLKAFLASDGKPYFIDKDGEFWRVINFVEPSTYFDLVDNANVAFEAGKAISAFQCWLVDLPGGPLYSTIEHFNDPEFLVKRFYDVLKADCCNRASAASSLIETVSSRTDEMQKLIRLGKEGKIPYRTAHNDTKVNNILFDPATNKALLLIDLDTTMTGFALNDFGDATRTGTNKACEDEADLSKIGVNLDYFAGYVKGYLTNGVNFLNECEKDNLAFASKLYPFIIGLRFITDYLEGDKYFKIHHEHHNLQRAKSQFQLMLNMEENFDKMCKIVDDTYNELKK